MALHVLYRTPHEVERSATCSTDAHWWPGPGRPKAPRRRAALRRRDAEAGPACVGIVHAENIASQRVLSDAGLTFISEADYCRDARLPLCHDSRPPRRVHHQHRSEPMLDVGLIHAEFSGPLDRTGQQNSCRWLSRRQALANCAMASEIYHDLAEQCAAWRAVGDGLCLVRPGCATSSSSTTHRRRRGWAPAA